MSLMVSLAMHTSHLQATSMIHADTVYAPSPAAESNIFSTILGEIITASEERFAVDAKIQADLDFYRSLGPGNIRKVVCGICMDPGCNYSYIIGSGDYKCRGRALQHIA